MQDTAKAPAKEKASAKVKAKAKATSKSGSQHQRTRGLKGAPAAPRPLAGDKTKATRAQSESKRFVSKNI